MTSPQRISFVARIAKAGKGRLKIEIPKEVHEQIKDLIGRRVLVTIKPVTGEEQ